MVAGALTVQGALLGAPGVSWVEVLARAGGLSSGALASHAQAPGLALQGPVVLLEVSLRRGSPLPAALSWGPCCPQVHAGPGQQPA